VDESAARRMWELFEPIHDVAYFTPEVRAAADELGMRGFWMGYFAFRAAALGAVTAATATAVFFSFPAHLAARALPDAWQYAGPEQALSARAASAERALRRIFGATVSEGQIAEAADLAWEAAAAADSAGRVLSTANQALPRPESPLQRLWQATTTLREHRGDGHIAVLVSSGIDPIRAQLLKTAAGESDEKALRDGRKWNAELWEATKDEMRDEGWIDDHGALTAAGEEVHAELERLTDAAALSPWIALGQERTERLAGLLVPLTAAVRDAGVVPAANPVGVTAGP
jgi:hypothetical protein